MCYYNRLIVPEHTVFSIGDLSVPLPDDAGVNKVLQSGFEYQQWPIIRWDEKQSHPECIHANWEFPASWVKTRKELESSRQKYTTLNAVGENLLGSPLYRGAAQYRRCLIPSSGFYEWRHTKLDGAKKETAIPYFVYLPGLPIVYMVGVWQAWTDQETGEYLIGFAIITTSANGLMEKVHNRKKRMPVIFKTDLAIQWLQTGLTSEEIRTLAEFQYPESEMAAYPIQKDFRQVSNPIDEFIYTGLSPL